MTERDITKLSSDLYDEGLRGSDRQAVAERTGLEGAELDKVLSLLAYYDQLIYQDH